MVDKILTDIYRIEIPIPKSPLKALNAYLIKGKERSLLVDTGLNRQESLRTMLQGLDELHVDLDRTDLFITHLHADHLGLSEELYTGKNKVYFSEKEATLVMAISERVEERFQELYRYYIANGFPGDELDRAVKYHPGFRYTPENPPPFSVLKEGDTLEVGDYAFRCIETPGHSPCHMCLYEEGKKILFSGDHILFNITPNITRWPEFEDSLHNYLASLDRTYNLEVDLVLPGHRSIMKDHRQRIRELQEHHSQRLVEALTAVTEGAETAWEVAPKIHWDLVTPSWDTFPSVQKWFAIGETIAHLKYLEYEGKINSRNHNNRIVYSQK
ncbi:MAG: MBL fold metallo-hydrolase [Deltaproteobacteria bacterium]|nr:MBL fold metallo-hydrolase [Deltaproteobacteria bacterium]